MPWGELVAQLKADGVNSVTLTVSAGVMRQASDSGFDPELNYNPEREAIRKLAELIKANGMSVVITTFVNMADIITGDTTKEGQDRPFPTDPVAWLAAFRTSVLEWASFSNEVGASGFIPFLDETQHLFKNPDLTSGWLSLITDIRKV